MAIGAVKSRPWPPPAWPACLPPPPPHGHGHAYPQGLPAPHGPAWPPWRPPGRPGLPAGHQPAQAQAMAALEAATRPWQAATRPCALVPTRFMRAGLSGRLGGPRRSLQACPPPPPTFCLGPGLGPSLGPGLGHGHLRPWPWPWPALALACLDLPDPGHPGLLGPPRP